MEQDIEAVRALATAAGMTLLEQLLRPLAVNVEEANEMVKGVK